MSLATPVALFIYNRPDQTRRVFDAIAAARPRMLFVIADGPRRDRRGDEGPVTAAREIVRNVNWSCTVERDYSDENLGCGKRVASGLTWVFESVGEAIVLEDDCLPDESFFPFCEELLARYQSDSRVMGIGGTAPVEDRAGDPSAYYFSKYFHGWGWASWRRAWRHFDFGMTRWPEFKYNGAFDRVCDSPKERDYWMPQLDRIHRGTIDIWDYQWQLACWIQQGLFACPYDNLVSNIGFGPDATHTRRTGHPLACRPTRRMGSVQHAACVTRNRRADALEFAERLHGHAIGRSLGRRLRSSFRQHANLAQAWPGETRG